MSLSLLKRIRAITPRLRPGARVLVLGAGFGGLELASVVSERCGSAVEVTLVDRGEGFVFGFSKLDVMFGRTVPGAVRHSYRDLVKPGVRFVQATIRSIDPVQRRVDTDAGAFEADVMVVALGADLDPAATPGLVEAGREFYTVDGGFAARDVLASFGGGRVVLPATSVHALALLGDGSVLAAGETVDASISANRQMQVARISAAGGLVAGYGTGGLARSRRMLAPRKREEG